MSSLIKKSPSQDFIYWTLVETTKNMYYVLIFGHFYQNSIPIWIPITLIYSSSKPVLNLMTRQKKILWYSNAMMENCVYSILKKTNKTQINYHSYSLISDVHTYIILKNLVGHIPSKKYRKTNLYQKLTCSLIHYPLRYLIKSSMKIYS